VFTDDQGVKRETSEELAIEQKLDLILSEIRRMRDGFPKDDAGAVDYEGHRKYHEHLIRSAEAQVEFWNELKKEVAKKGIIAVLVIVCGLLWLGAQAKLGITIR
jgi:hypothetical protein